MESGQMHDVAGQVRRSRKAREWTQTRLAMEARVAPGTVNSIENGRRVRPGSLRAVMGALDIPVPSEPQPADGGIKLAMDLVRQWLTSMDESERAPAIQELTRFTVLGEWRRP